MANEYPAFTLEQIARIPVDVFPRFLVEFPVMVGRFRDVLAFNDAIGKLGQIDLTDVKWVDDDMSLITSTFTTEGDDGVAVQFFSTVEKMERPDNVS